MTCAEFKELVEAHALGVLSPEERAACEAHLSQATHAGCLEALRRANEAAAALGQALPPVAPSPSSWAAIEARTGGAATPTASPRARRPLLPWIVAAAAALLVAWTLRDRVRLQDELRAAADRAQAQSSERARCVADLERLRADARLQRDALALLGQPGAKVVTLAPAGGPVPARGWTSANVIVRAGDARAFLVGHNLQAPAGRDYELWVIRGARKIPAGLLRGDATGTLVTALDPALLREGLPDALAVTLEDTGGHDSPEGPIVAVGKI